MENNFLASEYKPSRAEEAAFWVIPCPMEKSVSYGHGAANGPAAILAASQELEAMENGIAPGQGGFYTTPPVNCDGPAEAVLTRVEAIAEKCLAQGSIPVLLGGEHTASLGALRAVKFWADKRHREVGIVQFDAHADLRDEYRGNRLSHASVMRRELEELGMPIVQFAVRDISPEEVAVREKYDITHYDAYFMARVGLPEQPLPDTFPEYIYISFDVDAFDSSLMPATGTPSPGGINWREAHFILESCIRGHRVAGIDIMELAPIAGLHHADFTAAKLTHLLMALAWQARGEKK